MFQLGMISQSLLVCRLLKPLTPVVRHYGTMEVRRPKKRKRELAPSVRTMPCTVVDLPLDSQLRELCKDPDYAAKTFAEHPPRPDGVIGVHFHSLLSSTVLVYIHDTKGFSLHLDSCSLHLDSFSPSSNTLQSYLLLVR
jgi:hypothetical protein